MPWQVINYTGFYVLVVAMLTTVVFGARYLLAPDSELWIPLGVLALMMTAMTLHFVRKLASLTEFFEGVSAIAIVTFAFGLTAASLWVATLLPSGIPLGAGSRAAGLMLSISFTGYLLFMTVDCISTERRIFRPR